MKAVIAAAAAEGVATSSSLTFRLLGELRPYRRRLALGTLCLIVAAPATLFHPLVWMFVVDEVLVGGKFHLLVPALVVMVAVHGIFAVLVGAWRDRIFERVGVDFAQALRNRVYQKLSRQSVAYIHHQRTGDLMARAIADVDAIQGSLLHGVSSILAELASFVCVFGAICALSWKIGLATFLPLAVVFGIVSAFNGKLKASYRASRELLGLVSARLQDNLSGFRVTRAFGQERAEEDRFRSLTARHGAEQLRAVRLRTTVFPTAHFVGFTSNALMLGVGGWLVYRGEFTLGGLIALRGYWSHLNGPIRTIAQVSDLVQRLHASARRVYAVLDAPIALVDRPGARPLARPRSPLVLSHVTFGYEPGRDILRDLSLTIRPGERVALAGGSGAGKSTLLNLLARFHDPTHGTIAWGGQLLPEILQSSWRPRLALVLQDTFLFHESIRDNLRYGRPEPSEAEIVTAARRANAHDFIAQLPQGYDSLVGERGVKLSGGQRQRIGVARAFLANPEVLLLDEPTSAVEPESEAIIQESLIELMEGRTVVLTSHRPSLLARADRVIILEQGSIAEEGPPAQLLARGGRFADLYRAWQGDIRPRAP